MRALRFAGRATPSAAVVLQDHALRPAIARQHRRARLVGSHEEGADQLDRAQRGRAHRLPRGRPRRGDQRLHDASRHLVWRDIHGVGAGASTGRSANRAGQVGGRGGIQGAGRGPRPGRAAEGRQGKNRRLSRRLRHQPGDGCAHPDLDRRLRADGIRRRRDHGRSGTRYARFRVRRDFRLADRARHRAGR